MPEKLQTLYVCTTCDAQFLKWSGRCSECGAWGTLTKQVVDQKEKRDKALADIAPANVIDLKSIKQINLNRLATKINEIDRVLGGGIVPGSLILLSGEPGIGKSTIAMQIAEAIKAPTLYVSGEESAPQVKARLDRLNCVLPELSFVGETNIEKIIATAKKIKPALLIVDSIQTVYSSLIPTEAGSITQIRAAAVRFLELAKNNDIAVILIGHITKDGQVAGPKSLEHIVDTVLYLETENINNYSLLRVTKNRFGGVNEVGVLEMTGQGFKEVKDPSRVFLENQENKNPGSVISCVLEGSRPFLVNIQSLVTKTVFGYPQRKASGFDLNRLQVLAAVLSKRQKLNLATADIILNIVGGLKINDPGLDLAVCLAIISSLLNIAIEQQTVVLGEVGLSGEVRAVSKIEQRLGEAEKLGLTTAIIPYAKIDHPEKFKKLKIIEVKDINDLLEKVIKK